MADLREHLRSLYESEGRLTPDLVVARARDVTHPFHPYVFDKPVTEAAEVYYRQRAERLIREQFVVYAEASEDGPARSVREWHPVKAGDGTVYEPAEKVADNPLMAAMVLTQMKREYRALEARFGHMQEFVQLAQSTVRKAKRGKVTA